MGIGGAVLSQAPATFGAVQVEVVRSPKRRKTVQARLLDGGVLRVAIPASATVEDEARYVELMTRRFARRGDAAQIDLAERARVLAGRYGLPQAQSIRWVDNQLTRWASCTPLDGSVRVSSRAAAFPHWVIDYLVVHELAHLVHAEHSRAFWALVGRDPLTERARGYLIAKGAEPD